MVWLLATENRTPRGLVAIMTKSVCIHQIEHKICLFEREREQVVKHLALWMISCKAPLTPLVLEYRHSVGIQYCPFHFQITYKLHQHHFKGKLRKMVLEVLKKVRATPLFYGNELITLVLIKDDQANKPISAQHTIYAWSVKAWIKAL